MTKPRILLVSNSDASFVLTDYRILSEIGQVQFLVYRGRRDLLRLVTGIARSDLVVCWFALGYATTSAVLGRAMRKPIVVIAGGWDIFSIPNLEYGAILQKGRTIKTRIALRGACQVLAVSEAARAATRRLVEREVLMIYPGIDGELFFPEEGLARPQVVSVAGIENENRFRIKGVEFLFRIASHLPEIPFFLVGRNSPEWDKSLNKQAPPNMTIVGYLRPDELRRLYQRSRVYIQASAHESFGVSVAEAMACACVPVVTDRGALPEVVGSSGFVIPFGDVPVAVSAVKQALQSDGRPARQRVSDQFSFGARRKALLDLLTPLITGESDGIPGDS